MSWHPHTETYRRQEYLARIESDDNEDVVSIEEEVDSETVRVLHLAINEHNLNLILAAPELRDALTAVLQWYDNCGGVRQEDAAIDAARAALAKAAGEEVPA